MGIACMDKDDVAGLLVHRAAARKEGEDKIATLRTLAAREVLLQSHWPLVEDMQEG